MTKERALQLDAVGLTVEVNRLLKHTITYNPHTDYNSDTYVNWEIVLADGGKWTKTYVDTEVVNEEVIRKLEADDYAKDDDLALGLFEHHWWPRHWTLFAWYAAEGLTYQIQDSVLLMAVVTEKTLASAVSRAFILSHIEMTERMSLYSFISLTNLLERECKIRGWSLPDLAKYMGVDELEIDDLMKGEPSTVQIAKKLADTMGFGDEEYWMSIWRNHAKS